MSCASSGLPPAESPTKRATWSQSLWPKIFVVLAFSLIWFVIAVGKARARVGEFGLDPDWLMSLAAMWRQGSISGRDFHFTYGPVAQILAWLGVGGLSPFEAYPRTILAWYTTGIVLFGTMVLCIGEIGPAYTALFYLAVGALDLFWEPPSFRTLLALMAVVAVGKALASRKGKSRRIWSAAGGIFCVIGQLTTLEVGLYAFSAATILCLGYIVYALRSKEPAALRGFCETLMIVWGCYVGGNLLVDAVFWYSGGHYSLFDYQRFALETLRGYTYGMGLAWELHRKRTMGLVSVMVYTAVAAVTWIMKGRISAPARPIILGMTVVSLLSLKGALIRSDMGHVVAAMAPMVVVFLTLGRWSLPALKRPESHRKFAISWLGALVVLFVYWPIRPAVAAVLKLGIAASLAGMTSSLYSPPLPNGGLPRTLSDALGSDTSRPMLNFPYENHIGILLHRRLVAPVLESHNAGTIALQQFYVKTLEEAANRDLDVTYSVDQTVAWPIDGVQTISRVPIVFDYLYRNFELREYADGVFLLRRRQEPRRMTFRALFFQTAASHPESILLQLQHPATCGLVRLQMQMDYSYAALFLRPARLIFRVLSRGAVVTIGEFVPIAPNEPFDTFLSIVAPNDFDKLFADGRVPSPVWDSLSVAVDGPDHLAAAPREWQISRIECVDSERFAALDSEANPAP